MASVTLVQPSPPTPPIRASAALTALASVLAGFGLGTLALGLARPVPGVAALPAPELRAHDTGARAPDTERTPAPWPEAFGEPPGAAPSPPPEAPRTGRRQRPEPPPEPAYTLRGIVIDPDGGWVLAEGPEGIELVRHGGQLSGGERVIEITRRAVVLESRGESRRIEFDE